MSAAGLDVRRAVESGFEFVPLQQTGIILKASRYEMHYRKLLRFDVILILIGVALFREFW
jgi:hypothetical protein